MPVGNRSPNTKQIQYEVLESKIDRVDLLVGREENQHLLRTDQLHAIPYTYSSFQGCDFVCVCRVLWNLFESSGKRSEDPPISLQNVVLVHQAHSFEKDAYRMISEEGGKDPINP